jgi:hypothetical protein
VLRKEPLKDRCFKIENSHIRNSKMERRIKAQSTTMPGERGTVGILFRQKLKLEIKKQLARPLTGLWEVSVRTLWSESS